MSGGVKFSLIGRTLKHSYSKIIHARLGDYPYDLVELEPNDVERFVKSKEYKGFNVTIPYKSVVMEYLDEIDPMAKKIGAVNTVVNENGRLKGYNTDFYGMTFMIDNAGIEICGKVVMILGSGGTSKTATALCESKGAKEIVTVSRSGVVNYENCKERKDVQVIINTTPVGMFPDNYSCPVDIDDYPLLEGVVDVVYNPSKTLLCYNAGVKGIKNVNGFYMLVAQAKYACDRFLGKVKDDDVIDKVYDELSTKKRNVVLIGMPGSGKSTVGKELAKLLDREFIDTDKEIEKQAGTDIPTIFKEHGEEYFRELESKVIKEVGSLTEKVIATGGGVVKNIKNLYPLKSNGKLFFLKRELESLATGGRPLSKDVQTVKKLYEERKDMYEKFLDVTISNDGELCKTVKEIMEKL